MHENLAGNSENLQNFTTKENLYERLGGRPCLERVHKRFYEKLFNHPILSAFFKGKQRQHQEDQQTDFMVAQFGGPNIYGGRFPDTAHEHMFITEAHFELRSRILSETLDECGIAPALRDQWVATDYKFKKMIVKMTVDECKKRYTKDEILIAPNA